MGILGMDGRLYRKNVADVRAGVKELSTSAVEY
jgi:hypothetical protein